ncbi:ATP-binding cassette domain-containing protein [Congregibacter sp.]|uniref:ATP-binding cassette domain-containing protein n=1 Tax=Congregibacter sp. TaxID=2744308 RepID=UPI003F6C6554
MSILVRELGASRGTFNLNVPFWEARSGDVHAVLGANGAGKSSFFGALTQEFACTGDVCLHGGRLSEWPALSRARHVGVLPQQSQTAFMFTAAEVVSLGLTPLSLSRRHGQQRISTMLERVGCQALADRAYPSLSGGERQRVNLARVLLQLSEADKAPLLLLDEPTSAQDLGQQHAIMALTRRLAKEEGYIVVAILHDLNHALRYCDQCLLLDRGRAVASGQPSAILSPDAVEAHWGYRPVCAELSGHRVIA